MKKLLLSLMAIVMLSITANATANMSNEVKLPTELNSLRKIKLKLELGRQSKGCTGFGVCGAALTYTDEIMGVNIEVDIVTVGTVNRMASTMTEKSYQIIKNHFGSDAFIIEEDFTLDRATSKEIGFADAYTIKKGTYTVKYDSKTKLYSVLF